MFFKIDRASLKVGSKSGTVFSFFYFVFEGNFPSTSPRGAYIWRDDLTEGFLRYRLGGLYLEGLIFYGTSVLDLSGKMQQTVGLLSAKGFVGSLALSG